MLYGQIITSTGWTYAAVDALYLPEVEDLLVYWSTNPPLHMLLGGLIGGLTGRSPGKDGGAFVPSTEEELAGLMKHLGGK